jgi:hypothetical protein
MKVAEYKEGKLVTIWHDRACAERCGATDVRELPDNHPDFLAWIAAAKAEREARENDREDLRSQIQDETESAWLARTDAARWKIVLKLFKAFEKRV